MVACNKKTIKTAVLFIRNGSYWNNEKTIHMYVCIASGSLSSNFLLKTYVACILHKLRTSCGNLNEINNGSINLFTQYVCTYIY